MAEQHLPHAAHPDAPVIRHETSDANIRGVFGFAAALALGTMFVMFLVWVLFRFLDARTAPAGAPQFPLAAAQASRVPPAPRLQVNPREDLRELRAKEDQQLTTYGWVDKGKGVVRIPIEQAMKLAVQRGLNARSSGDSR